MTSHPAPDWLPGWIPPPPHESLIFDDGEPLESQWHRDEMNLLIELFRFWLAAGRDDFYVGGNQALYFSAIQARNRDFRAPDVFVVLGTAPHDRDGWVVWEEDGKVPDLVIELTSPSTEKADREEKFRIYERVLRVREYFIYDPRTATLEGWRNDATAFAPISPDAQGRLESVVARAALGTWRGPVGLNQGTWLRLFDRQGVVVPSRQELALVEAQRADAAAQRAEAEAQRATELEARLAAYEARFGALDGD